VPTLFSASGELDILALFNCIKLRDALRGSSANRDAKRGPERFFTYFVQIMDYRTLDNHGVQRPTTAAGQIMHREQAGISHG
jgi:hypothetical protein